MKKEPKIIAALLHKDDKASDISKLVSIDNAERGRAYFCPDCKGDLGVRKGEKNAHHFYHKSDFSCVHQGETYLHLLAKNVIEKVGSLWIPDISYFWFYINPVETTMGEVVFITDKQITNSGFDFGGLFSLSETESFAGNLDKAKDFLKSNGGVFPWRVEPINLTKTFKFGLMQVGNVRSEYFLDRKSVV